MKKRQTDVMHVPTEFFQFVRQKKADNPNRFRTNYDVLDDLMGQRVEEKRKRGGFFGKI